MTLAGAITYLESAIPGFFGCYVDACERLGLEPAPESFPTRIPSRARATRTRARSSSNAQPASLRPNVVGSAWTPWVRPIWRVSRCSWARAVTVANCLAAIV